MADYEIRKRANIGSSSLILIFIVLCLATFGLLALGNARREAFFSEKNAAAVVEYYRADSLAEEFVTFAGETLKEIYGPETAGTDTGIKSAGEAAKTQVLERMGDYYNGETDTLYTDISMAAGQALRVELGVDWDAGTYRILAWNVYNQENYQIDQSVPIWTGSGS